MRFLLIALQGLFYLLRLGFSKFCLDKTFHALTIVFYLRGMAQTASWQKHQSIFTSHFKNLAPIKTKWVHKPAALLFTAKKLRFKMNRKTKMDFIFNLSTAIWNNSATPQQSMLALEWVISSVRPKFNPLTRELARNNWPQSTFLTVFR